jgi:hypothetical protein
MGGPQGVLQSSCRLESGATAKGWLHNRRESLMKLYVDASTKQVTVSRDPVEKTEQNGRQRTERGTGRLMWSTQVFVLDDDGGEVIAITTAGEKPNVKVGTLVTVSKLEALPWATNGRNGVAFRAEEIKAAGAASARSV